VAWDKLHLPGSRARLVYLRVAALHKEEVMALRKLRVTPYELVELQSKAAELGLTVGVVCDMALYFMLGGKCIHASSDVSNAYGWLDGYKMGLDDGKATAIQVIQGNPFSQW